MGEPVLPPVGFRTPNNFFPTTCGVPRAKDSPRALCFALIRVELGVRGLEYMRGGRLGLAPPNVMRPAPENRGYLPA